MSEQNPHDCFECTGRGWLVMLNTDTRALELQRCDACSRFDSDADAQKYVASDDSAVAAVLSEFCNAILAESERMLANKKPSCVALIRALTMIRDSLRNAMALHPNHSTGLESSPRFDQTGLDATGSVKRPYLVGVREVHVRHYKVEAANPEDAKSLVNQRAPEVEDVEFEEYSHELDPDTWSVEETKHE
ncbi:MAG: hypothetical protein HUU46_07520 [Candidatus Hydrogenedentes bacterium]|nr:hypothetical protein [Candidatus Hydrogenedentota bacterium]